jgi:hypothetical protein
VLTLWVEGDGHDGGEGRRDVAGDIGQGRQTDVGELAHLLGSRGKQLHLKVVLGAVWEAPGPWGVMHPLIIDLTVPQPSVYKVGMGVQCITQVIDVKRSMKIR